VILAELKPPNELTTIAPAGEPVTAVSTTSPFSKKPIVREAVGPPEVGPPNAVTVVWIVKFPGATTGASARTGRLVARVKLPSVAPAVVILPLAVTINALLEMMGPEPITVPVAGGGDIRSPPAATELPGATARISPGLSEERESPTAAIEPWATKSGVDEVSTAKPARCEPASAVTELSSHRSSSHSKPGVRAIEQREAQAPRCVINKIAHHNHNSIGTAASTRHPVKLKPCVHVLGG
jgi:hypothetical protein